jgi:hypothetical protein
MSGIEGLSSGDIRAKLDHPVIDADAHVVECDFAHLDFVRQLGGETMVKKVSAVIAVAGPTVRGFWWGIPSGPLTGDRAMAQLPRYLRSRMDELGIDFGHCYTTRGLSHMYIPDEDTRRTSCRALNMLYAEMYAEVGDRLRPVAVIPTYTPQEAIEELDLQPSGRFRQWRGVLLPLDFLQRCDAAVSRALIRFSRRRRILGRQSAERHCRALGKTQRRCPREKPQSRFARR